MSSKTSSKTCLGSKNKIITLRTVECCKVSLSHHPFLFYILLKPHGVAISRSSTILDHNHIYLAAYSLLAASYGRGETAVCCCPDISLNASEPMNGNQKNSCIMVKCGLDCPAWHQIAGMDVDGLLKLILSYGQFPSTQVCALDRWTPGKLTSSPCHKRLAQLKPESHKMTQERKYDTSAFLI